MLSYMTLHGLLYKKWPKILKPVLIDGIRFIGEGISNTAQAKIWKVFYFIYPDILDHWNILKIL